MAKKKDAKKETEKKHSSKKGASKKEVTESIEIDFVRPSVRLALAKLSVVEKPMGRSVVRGKKQKPEIKEIVKEIEKEVVKEVEVIKEVEKEIEIKQVMPYICLQYLGGESDINEIVEKAKAIWQENNHSGEKFVSIDLYVKPEDNAAYYVINGMDTGKVELGL